MLVSDIVNSCSNDQVAAAAVASIGGPFAIEVRKAAEGRGIAPGRFSADAVRRFAREATEADLADLHDAVRGSDLPVLVGFNRIVDRCIAAASRKQADHAIDTIAARFPY